MPSKMHQSSYTFLIVDDEPFVLAALKRNLRSFQANLLTAKNANEAFKIIREKEVHVMLTDFRMPEVNGIDVCNLVKEISPGTIRIIMSGHIDLPKIQSQVPEDLVFNYLLKPWEERELHIEIENALEEWKLQNKLRLFNNESNHIKTEDEKVKNKFEELSGQFSQHLVTSKKIIEQKHRQLKFMASLFGALASGVDKDGFAKLIDDKKNILLKSGDKEMFEEINSHIKLASDCLDKIEENKERIKEWEGTLNKIKEQTNISELLANSKTKHELMQELYSGDSISSTPAGLEEIVNTISSPLNSIIEFLEFISEDYEDAYISNEIVNLKKELDILLKRLEAVLTIAKFEEEKKISEIDLNNLITETLTFFSESLKTAGVIAELNLSREIATVSGEKQKLQHVCFNLIEFAIESMKNGGILTIESKSDDKGLTYITFSDTGRGISHDEMAQIFDPLAGFGLSLCQNIIKEHRGNIMVSSKIDEGTKFTIALPQSGGRA